MIPTLVVLYFLNHSVDELIPVALFESLVQVQGVWIRGSFKGDRILERFDKVEIIVIKLIDDRFQAKKIALLNAF